MRYYRVRSVLASPEPDEMIAADRNPIEEADIWNGGRGRHFVLVARKSWHPPTDIYETASDVVVKMEVAGMNEASLQIAIEDDILTIRGRRADETQSNKIGYHHMGISYGEFASDIQVPGPIDQERVRAEYSAGFLTVWLPKMPPRSSGAIRISITDNPF